MKKLNKWLVIFLGGIAFPIVYSISVSFFVKFIGKSGRLFELFYLPVSWPRYLYFSLFSFSNIGQNSLDDNSFFYFIFFSNWTLYSGVLYFIFRCFVRKAKNAPSEFQIPPPPPSNYNYHKEIQVAICLALLLIDQRVQQIRLAIRLMFFRLSAALFTRRKL